MGGGSSPAMPVAGWTRAGGGLAGDVLAVMAGSSLLAASAWVQVPMWPVPTTMQTVAVMIIGASCRPRLGAAAAVLRLLPRVAEANRHPGGSRHADD